MNSFLDHVTTSRGLAKNSVLGYRRDLQAVATFLADKRRRGLDTLTSEDVRAYLRHVPKTSSGATERRRFAALRLFLDFLRTTGRDTGSPLLPADRPAGTRQLPRVLTKEQVGRMLEPDPAAPLAARDRAILHLTYRGLSASAVCELKCGDVNVAEGYVRLDRIVPIGRDAADAVDLYLRTCRPKLNRRGSDLLFLSRTGKPMERVALWMLVTRHGARIGSGDTASPRAIQQSFATHRLQDGADVRDVQMILGHSDVESTRVYTRTSPLAPPPVQ